MHNISDRLKISALSQSSESVIGISAKSHIGATLVVCTNVIVSDSIIHQHAKACIGYNKRMIVGTI